VTFGVVVSPVDVDVTPGVALVGRCFVDVVIGVDVDVLSVPVDVVLVPPVDVVVGALVVDVVLGVLVVVLPVNHVDNVVFNVE
jgi:hypothetical protein